jgi:hypothetical protein
MCKVRSVFGGEIPSGPPRKSNKKKVSVTREVILKNIAKYLDSAKQWRNGHQFDNAYKYASKAEALIELLEVQDCGSVGGFDPDNPLSQLSDWQLMNRFLTLKRK